MCVYVQGFVYMYCMSMRNAHKLSSRSAPFKHSYSVVLLGPLLASESSANIVNIFGVMTVSLSQMAVVDVCAGLLSASAHAQSFRSLQLNNSQIQTSQFIFSIPDLSSLFSPFRLGSVLFCSVACRRLKCDEKLW